MKGLLSEEAHEACKKQTNEKLKSLKSALKALAKECIKDPEDPKIITLCGSSKFCGIMAVCAWLLEKEENKIAMGLHLLPSWYPDVPEHHLAEHEGVADQMDKLHFKKIELSSEIFVVNFDGYVGESTANEIEYAKKNGVKIRWFTDDPIGKKVRKMLENIKE